MTLPAIALALLVLIAAPAAHAAAPASAPGSALARDAQPPDAAPASAVPASAVPASAAPASAVPASAAPAAADPAAPAGPATASTSVAADDPAADAPPTPALPGWHERGFGLQVEGGFAALFLDDPQGSAFAGDAGAGARVSYDLSRLVNRPLGIGAPIGFSIAALWYHVALPDDAGTRAVQVLTSFDYLAIPLQAGWEFGGGPWRIVPYLAAGPAVTRVAVDYRIEDPVGAGSGAPVETRSLRSFLPGAAYGLGTAFGWRGEESFLGITGRIELLRFRRGPNDDLSLGFALGLLL